LVSRLDAQYSKIEKIKWPLRTVRLAIFRAIRLIDLRSIARSVPDTFPHFPADIADNSVTVTGIFEVIFLFAEVLGGPNSRRREC
jgi:hypothetical protein